MLSIEFVHKLPENGDSNRIYYIEETIKNKHVLNGYIFINGVYELIYEEKDNIIIVTGYKILKVRRYKGKILRKIRKEIEDI